MHIWHESLISLLPCKEIQSPANCAVLSASRYFRPYMPPLDSKAPAFCPPLGKCFCNLFCNFFFIAKERSPEILIELYLDLCDILENSVLLDTRYPFDFDNIQRWRQEFSYGGADSSDRGAKIRFSGYYKCQKSSKILCFTFRRRASILRRGS